MAKPFPYSSFDQISPGAQVHLRLVEDAAGEEAPRYENARLDSAIRASGNVRTGTFFIPSLGHSLEITDKQYTAWTRHS